MQPFEIVFLVSNILCAVGAAKLLWGILQKHKVLSGYSPEGSFITALSVTGFMLGFILSHQWGSVAFSLPVVCFWWVAAVNSIFCGG
jgi:hypothetical protein